VKGRSRHPNGSGTIPFQVGLTPAARDTVREAADLLGISMSRYVNGLIVADTLRIQTRRDERREAVPA